MIVYWGNIGIMENRMETTGIIAIIKGLFGDYKVYIGVILGHFLHQGRLGSPF